MEQPVIIRHHSRRTFLKGAVVLTGVLTSGTLLAALAPSRVWALEVHTLNQHQADTLLTMAKRLYPHKDLPDAVYAILVKDLDEASRDDKVHTLVSDGVAALDKRAGGNWLKAPADKQLDILTAMQSDAFFQKVRGQCITSLYDNQMAYKHFGYQGESWSKGGYIKRGFNDLTWLPDPPASASPPPFNS
ncbi:tat (twin-arginine translocation) pathway signal sequence [Castellaniella sp.]|uniref:tat (twin-arginine translocation) pathway signal sequence n=1 Tax=Castellaniella sp. TaxID=1955812 RepID=UPI003C76BA33